MDFQQCLSILQARPPLSVDNITSAPTGLPAVVASIPAAAEVQLPSVTLSSFQLVKEYNHLQEMRISVYKYFDDELLDIIEGNCPARYPLICKEVTQKFSDISSSINHIKDILDSRDKADLSSSIAKIQSLEKEKLVLVAAHHLDQLKSSVLAGTENVTGSKTPEQVEYLANQIATCQLKIVETMEDIQCHLCDLVEEDEA